MKEHIISENKPPNLIFDKLVWTVKDVTEVLKCSERHVRELVSSEQIPYAKVGRLVRFYRDQVLEWVRKGGTQ